MADHYTLIERQHRNARGYEIEWELWGGLDLRDPRAGHATGDLIEIYDDDERDEARIHCKALNYDLTADLLAWLANPDGVATDGALSPHAAALDVETVLERLDFIAGHEASAILRDTAEAAAAMIRAARGVAPTEGGDRG